MGDFIGKHSRFILDELQIRKSKKQKEGFRDWLCRVLEDEGYAPVVEKARNMTGSHNVVVGDPEKARLILGAHYDTCAVMPFPNFITPRNFVVYLLYQILLVAVIFVVAAIPAAIVFWLGAVEQVALLVWYVALWICLWLMLGGKANRHTVNDNTSGVITLLEIALALPEEQREKVCFVFFDDEEKGVLGSAAFAKKHKKEIAGTMMLNFDCVSDGDYIQFYPTRKSKKNKVFLNSLEQAFPSTVEKTVEMVQGFGFYPSDQRSFPMGVAVCALKKKSLIGYYMNRIHTARDTVLDQRNLALLRDGVLRLIDAIENEKDVA